jgi:apolipoprotein N-acyltransferase
MNLSLDYSITRSWVCRLATIVLAAGAFHLAYAFPPLSVGLLVYLYCLLQLARAPTARLAFYPGLAIGMLVAAPQLTCFWRIFGPAAIVLWLVLAFWTGLFVALARLCLRQFRPAVAVLLIPMVWTGLEYFRSELYYLRFSWLNIGYGFSGNLPLPAVRFLGVYGLGLAAMGTVAALNAARAWRTRLAVGAVAAALFGSSWLIDRLPPARPAMDPGREVVLAGVQLEFPFEPAVIAALNHLVDRFPEASVLVLSEYTFDGPVPERVRLWCRDHQRYLIAGGKDPAPGDRFYDTAFVIGPDGEIAFRQGKAVPIQFFNDGLPAPRQALWESPWGKIGICVCYDLSYTRVTDALIREGAQALIVPTMDLEDWGRHEHELHARVAPIRAAEYDVPVFRLASSGVSQFVDASGKVQAAAPFPGELAVLEGRLRLASPGRLPLDRWLAPASILVTGACMGWFLVRYGRDWRRQRAGRAQHGVSVASTASQARN